MKYEEMIKKMIIVKPKVYMKNEVVKIKGINRSNIKIFEEMLKGKTITFNKFNRFKESMRNGMIPNEITERFKDLSLEDDKRDWALPFDPYIMDDNNKPWVLK
jgi:hypothetical protein